MPSTQRSSGFGSSAGSSRSKTAIVPGMMQVYNQLLGLNQQNYQNILSAYSTGMQNLQAQVGAIVGGYDTGKQEVLGMLGVTGGGWGVATPAAAAIQQNAAQSFGASQQQLINSGMGSGTVLAGVRTANQLAANQAMAGLGANLAQTAAGYASQFDLARSAAQMQALGMETNFTGQYMGDLAGYHFANTAGPLTGQFSQSQQQGMNSYEASGQSVESLLNSGRGGIGGGYGPGMETSGYGAGGPGYASLYGGGDYGLPITPQSAPWLYGGSGAGDVIAPQTDEPFGGGLTGGAGAYGPGYGQPYRLLPADQPPSGGGFS